MTDGVPQGIDGAGGGFAQQRLTRNCWTQARKLSPLMGPSKTAGAARRSWYKAARKVVCAVAVADMTDQALVLNGASVTRRHIGRHPGLVDEHQPGGVPVLLRGLPSAPRRLHLAALWFGVTNVFL